MRIGFVYFHFWPNVGGTEIKMYDYGRALASLGNEVTVFTANALKFKPACLPPEETRDRIRIQRFRFIILPMKFAFLSPGLIHALLRSKLDVIEVFSILPSFFNLSAILVARLRNIPVVLYPQFLPDRFDQDGRLWVRMAGKVFDLGIAIHIARMTQHIVAITELEERYFRRNGIDAVTTLYESVRRRAYPRPDEIDEFCERFGMSREDRIMLFVGRIDRRKGLNVLVEAFPEVLRAIPKARLLVVGEDWGALQRCLVQARSLACHEKVTMTGPLEEQELACAFALCDVVVVPSYFEAYGRVLLEAWEFGKPAIITDGVALRELLSGETGIVVKRGSPKALAKATIRILSDHEWAHRLGASAKSRMHARILAPEEVASALIRIYRELAAKRLRVRTS